MLEVRELFRTKKLGLQLGWDEEHDRAVVEKAPESRPWLLGLKLASVGERAVAPIETKRAWRALLESLAPRPLRLGFLPADVDAERLAAVVASVAAGGAAPDDAVARVAGRLSLSPDALAPLADGIVEAVEAARAAPTKDRRKIPKKARASPPPPAAAASDAESATSERSGSSEPPERMERPEAAAPAKRKKAAAPEERKQAAKAAAKDEKKPATPPPRPPAAETDSETRGRSARRAEDAPGSDARSRSRSPRAGGSDSEDSTALDESFAPAMEALVAEPAHATLAAAPRRGDRADALSERSERFRRRRAALRSRYVDRRFVDYAAGSATLRVVDVEYDHGRATFVLLASDGGAPRAYDVTRAVDDMVDDFRCLETRPAGTAVPPEYHMKRARRPSAWEDVTGGGDGAAAADGDASAAAAPDAPEPDAPEPDAPEQAPKQAPKKAKPASSKSSGKSVAWTCAACTFENWRGKKCGACGAEKPAAGAAADAAEAAGADAPPPPTPTPLPALSFRVGGDGVKRSGSPDRRKNKSPFAAEAPSPDRQRGRPVAHTSRADDLRAFVNRSLAGQTGTHTRFGDA